VSQSQPTEENRPIALKRAVRYLRFAVFLFVTLAVMSSWIAVATRARALAWLARGVLAVYFPPPFVTGSPDARLIGVAIFLVVAAFLVCRCRYWTALAALILPLVFTWVLAFKLMQG
jgi:hypothetical protein